MKRSRKLICWFVLTLICLVYMTGCEGRVNPNTGEREFRFDPNIMGQIEGGAAVGVDVMDFVSVFVPALQPVGLILSGALAFWLKNRKKYMGYKSERDILHDGAFVFVEALEELKKTDSLLSSKYLDLLDKYKKRIINSKELAQFEAIIRGMRGLPPKARPA